jgi:hypothetical protein
MCSHRVGDDEGKGGKGGKGVEDGEFKELAIAKGEYCDAT